jgi:hypothetical protein
MICIIAPPGFASTGLGESKHTAINCLVTLGHVIPTSRR